MEVALKFRHAALCVLCFSLVACGGGQKTTATTTNSNNTTQATGAESTAKSITGPANFTVSGSVGPGTNTKAAVVNAYDVAGKVCGSSVLTDSSGKYSLKAKCSFPVVIFADLPDGNDTGMAPDGSRGEGRAYFNYISEITKDGDSFTTNLSPTTSAITMLVLGRMPTPGSANPANVLNEARRVQAHAKIHEAIDPLAAALDAPIPDLISADLSPGGPLAKLLSIVQISLERIDSTKQTLIRFQAASEHRPVVLIATDGKLIADVYMDSGLGIVSNGIDGNKLKEAASVNTEIQSLMSGATSASLPVDSCFMHNGSNEPLALFDVPYGWVPSFSSSFENVTVLRLNTYADLANETLERMNEGSATMVFASFDFRNKHNLRQRAYTWLIKGAQNVSGCSSVGGGWRILGNQRPVYVKTDTIAFHETTVGQGFGKRADSYGTGTEHFVSDRRTTPFTHVLVTGPGMPENGHLMIRIPDGNSGEFINTTASISLLRTIWLSASPLELKNKKIMDTLQDSRAVVMSDLSVKKITDKYFDGSQNVYTYRFFNDYPDLYPTLTLVDVIPKRPYLMTELPIDYFHTVGVNIDNLVQSLQRSDPIQVNWSLPMDQRGKQMLPESVFVSRMNCRVPSGWPKCTVRNAQYNEYSLALTPLWDSSISTSTLVPEPLPILPEPALALTTFKGYVRVRLLDSLNRPIETRTGMDYAR